MVELLFIGICFRVGFADAFGHYLGIAAFVTCVFAIFALHASRVLEQLTAKGATNDAVKLLSDEFMAILLGNLFLALSNGSFSIET